jgi:hypothetical protein
VDYWPYNCWRWAAEGTFKQTVFFLTVLPMWSFAYLKATRGSFITLILSPALVCRTVVRLRPGVPFAALNLEVTPEA